MQLNLKKSTKSAPRWQILSTFLLAISLTGCASWRSPNVVETVSKPVEKTPLDIPLPAPLDVRPIEWMVITPQNAEEVFRALQAKGQDVVVFAITPDGYKSLSITWTEIRNLIALQRGIIIRYKDYYESKPTTPK